jgi:hypothetical protein
MLEGFFRVPAFPSRDLFPQKLFKGREVVVCFAVAVYGVMLAACDFHGKLDKVSWKLPVTGTLSFDPKLCFLDAATTGLDSSLRLRVEFLSGIAAPAGFGSWWLQSQTLLWCFCEAVRCV